jgi:hypothetical protein
MMRTVGDGGARRYLGVIWGGVVLVMALAVIFAFASIALAAPKGIFARFAQCPTSNPGVALCQRIEVTGGVFSIGKASIPIERPILVQGGAVHTGGPNFNEYFLVPPVNGELIPPNELTVAGGLQSLLGCPLAGCRSPYGGTVPNAVIASIESATSPANRPIFNLAAAIEEKGAAVTLPVRVQLRNALLGSACYLGSEAQPIELRLTDGATSPPLPNKPITGTVGVPASEVEGEYEAFAATGLTLVDNAFSVPVAKGCGGSLAFLVDPEIDRTLGLESPAGHNTAILKGVLHMAEAEAVLASEAFPGK